jgi:adenylate cyclase
MAASHGGRVIDTAGDSVLAEFKSVVEAVRCAISIQDQLRQNSESVAESRRMLYRIGVNLGDVIEEGGALYGDGVNVAARLQSLAEPGGVCISGNVFDQVETKLPLHFEFVGEQQVKNISKPVRVYRSIEKGSSSVSAKLSRGFRVSFRQACMT